LSSNFNNNVLRPGLTEEIVRLKIHAIGGRDSNQNVVATHEVYDPATNTWSSASSLPPARDHFGIVVLDASIHVVGGRSGGGGFGTGLSVLGRRGQGRRCQPLPPRVRFTLNYRHPAALPRTAGQGL
jgi:hypothetical protein